MKPGMLIYLGFIVLMSIISFQDRPLVVKRTVTVYDTVKITDTIPLRVDTVENIKIRADTVMFTPSLEQAGCKDVLVKIESIRGTTSGSRWYTLLLRDGTRKEVNWYNMGYIVGDVACVAPRAIW